MCLHVKILDWLLISYNYSLYEKGNNNPFLGQQKPQKHTKMFFSLSDIMIMSKERLRDDLSISQPANILQRSFLIRNYFYLGNHLFKKETVLQKSYANSPPPPHTHTRLLLIMWVQSLFRTGFSYYRNKKIATKWRS